MASGQKHPKHPQPYLIEEPVTGLYIHFGPHRQTLTAAPNATRFTTAGDAILATQGTPIAEQAHEIVRVSA